MFCDLFVWLIVCVLGVGLWIWLVGVLVGWCLGGGILFCCLFFITLWLVVFGVCLFCCVFVFGLLGLFIVVWFWVCVLVFGFVWCLFGFVACGVWVV